MEFEAFYTTSAGAIPVLLLATVLELAYSGKELRGEGPRKRADGSVPGEDLSVEELDRLIAELEEKARPQWWDRPSRIAAKASYTFPVLYALLAMVACLAVLAGTLPDSEFIRWHVQAAIVIQIFAFFMGLLQASRKDFDVFFTYRQRMNAHLATVRDLRARYLAIQDEKAGLDAERARLLEDSERLSTRLDRLESATTRLDATSEISPSGAGHHGTDSESTSETEGEEDGRIDNAEPGSPPGDRQ